MKNLIQLSVLLLSMTATAWMYASPPTSIINEDIEVYITNACADGQPNGAINLVIKNGVGPFDVVYLDTSGNIIYHPDPVMQANNPEVFGSEDKNDLLPGAYTIRITDAMCAVAIVPVIVGTNTHITLTTTPTPACTPGTGSITTAVTGGQAPYTYAWSNGATTQTSGTTVSVSGLDPGTYTVIVTDASGCSDVESVEVKAVEADIVLANKRNNCICINGSSCSGSMTASFEGDGQVISYQWYKGTQLISTIARVGELCDGTYLCKVTFIPTGASVPCTVEKSFEILSEDCNDKLQVVLKNFGNVQECGHGNNYNGFLEVGVTFDINLIGLQSK